MPDSFPTVFPNHAVEKTAQSVSLPKAMGDGYEKNIRFGLNLHRPAWRLTWQVSKTDADTIEAFLSARAADGIAFYWSPPDIWLDDAGSIDTWYLVDYLSNTKQKWRCPEWERTQTSAIWFNVDATFQQVYEPDSFALTPLTNFFADDTLCELDWGVHDGRYFVLKSDDSIAGSGNARPTFHSVIDRDNSYYTVHTWLQGFSPWPEPRSIVVTKTARGMDTNVAITWTKMYTNTTYSQIVQYGARLALDASNSLWAFYMQTVGSQAIFNFLKISKTDGSILQQKTLAVAGSVDFIVDFIIDSQNNFYVCGGAGNSIGSSSPFTPGFVVKFSSTFTPLWGARISGAYTNGNGASGYINQLRLQGSYLYLTCTSRTGGATGSPLVILNASTGVQVRQVKPLATTTGNIGLVNESVALDPEGNIYVASRQAGNDNRVLYVTRYNFAGERQYVKKLSITGSSADSPVYLQDARVLGTTTGRLFAAIKKFQSRYYIIEFDPYGDELSVREFKDAANGLNSTILDLFEPKYDKNGLLIMINTGDHACTTQDVETFEYPFRYIQTVATYPSANVPCTDLSGTFSFSPVNTWSSVASDFASVSSVFTAGTPTKQTFISAVEP